MNKSQHSVAVSAVTLDELIERVRSIPNIGRFHDLILPNGTSATRHQYEEISYRRWTTPEGEIRYDTCVELRP